MYMVRWQVIVALLLWSWVSGPALAQLPTDADLKSWVEKRIADWAPTRTERRFDDIGWAGDIRQALRLAKEHQRPVFLFSYDGNDLATYRC